MKKLLILATLLVSVKVVAAPVFLYPRCSNFGNSAECTIWNSSQYDVTCNISMRAFTKNGQMLTSFDYKIISRGMTSWSRINNYDFKNPITSVQATANCNSR